MFHFITYTSTHPNMIQTKIKLFAGCLLIFIFTIAQKHQSSPTIDDSSITKLVRKSVADTDTPRITNNDVIYRSRSTFVVPEYKLIFFAFPKVACTEWKRMFMRMNNNPKWCKLEGHDIHKRSMNQIQILRDFAPDVATEMMISDEWTKAAIFREPKERVLSAFLDKAIKKQFVYIETCCNNLPSHDLRDECITNADKFDSFLRFVTEYPEECFNVHWEPQVEKIDSKWWPYIDHIGYQHNLLEDSKEILSMITSVNDDAETETETETSISAWDKFGGSGWGAPDENETNCENRMQSNAEADSHSFLEQNTSYHNFDAGSKMKEWYSAELEKLVEEKWAVEWSKEDVSYPEVKLFGD